MSAMTQLRSGLLAAVPLMGLSAAALAQDWTMGPAPNRGLYIEGAGGANWAEDFDSESNFFPSELVGSGFGTGPYTFTSEFDIGYAVGGRVGYAFLNGFRVEGEVTYRNNDLDTVSISPALAPGVTAGDASGSIESVSLLANVLWDWRNTTRFTPYIGAGGGAAWVRQDLNVPLTSGVGATTAYRVPEKESWAPAVQGIAGVNVAITPAISVSVDYRYLHAFDVRTENNLGYSSRDDYSNHTVFLGVRYAFGAPEAVVPVVPIAQPQPPAPPPAPAQQVYLIFFDFDRSNLTPEGREVVSQVATRALQPGSGVQRIEVTGHTDRAGSPQYNQRLSQRRADTVRRALIERGIPDNEIVTRALGESEPRVPTPDGVREPQNRRVEIVYI